MICNSFACICNLCHLEQSTVIVLQIYLWLGPTTLVHVGNIRVECALQCPGPGGDCGLVNNQRLGQFSHVETLSIHLQNDLKWIEFHRAVDSWLGGDILTPH